MNTVVWPICSKLLRVVDPSPLKFATNVAEEFVVWYWTKPLVTTSKLTVPVNALATLYNFSCITPGPTVNEVVDVIPVTWTFAENVLTPVTATLVPTVHLSVNKVILST